MSIRTKFSFGILVLFLIIMILLVSSVVNLSRMSNKTNLILSENHYTVVYAREMSEELTNINQELNHSCLVGERHDSAFINNMLIGFNKSLNLEKMNITEVGESELVSSIEKEYKEYRDLLFSFSAISADKLILLQNKFAGLNHLIMLLSQMNEKAIVQKTNDAKVSAKNASIQMTIIGVICFLFALSFTYNFASYFNERFFQLYKGIKEIVSSNYGQRLYFDGKDEFYEISLLFNEMAEKLNESERKGVISTKEHPLNSEIDLKDLQELKKVLERMKVFEIQASELLLKLESKM